MRYEWSGSGLGSGNLSPPTNTATAVPGLSLVTPSVITGQVVLVWWAMSSQASSNTVYGQLALAGSVTGPQIQSSVINENVMGFFQRFTGLTGAQTFTLLASASSSAGAVYGAASSILAMIVNS